MDFSSFIVTHLDYFGTDPHIRYRDDAVRINSNNYQFPLTCIPQIEAFYKMRLRNGYTSEEPLTDSDYKYLEEGLEIKTIGRISVAICLRISYNKFGEEYRKSTKNGMSLRDLHEYVRGLPTTTSTVKETEFTWDGVTRTVQDWAESLGISPSAFRRRYKKYGLCARLFSSTHDIKQTMLPSAYDPDALIGTPEWRALSNKQPVLNADNRAPRRRPPLDIPLVNANNLIAAMIKDAVDNIKTRDKKYFDSSVQFLTNQSGYLKWLLDACPNCSSSYILKYLWKEYSKYLPVKDMERLYPEKRLKCQWSSYVG